MKSVPAYRDCLKRNLEVRVSKLARRKEGEETEMHLIAISLCFFQQQFLHYVCGRAGKKGYNAQCNSELFFNLLYVQSFSLSLSLFFCLCLYFCLSFASLSFCVMVFLSLIFFCLSLSVHLNCSVEFANVQIQN